VTELDIRNWLDKNGYFGRTASFEELELHAIRRPGWLQIYRFTVITKSHQGPSTRLFGTVRDDETETSIQKKTVVKTFADVESQSRQLDSWSAGLIVLSAGQKQRFVPLVCLALAMILFVGLFFFVRVFLES